MLRGLESFGKLNGSMTSHPHPLVSLGSLRARETLAIQWRHPPGRSPVLQLALMEPYT